MQHSKLLAALLTASILTACTEPDGSPGRGIENGGTLSKMDVGVVAGAVVGGVGGAFIGAGWGEAAAIVGGALLGGALGGAIGQSMDNADRAAYDRASQHAMNTGRSSEWRNPDSGHYGSIHPTRYYTDADGRSCREYTQKVYVDGKEYKDHGTACRTDDGTWKVVEERKS